MFGKYELDLKIKEKEFEIAVEGRGKKRRYYRKKGEEEVEKFIYAKEGNLVICPVEPVNLPKEGVSEYLMIELDKPFVIEPGMKGNFYIKFPVEIGVFLVNRKDVERIDIFTLTKPKYTLYGPPERGVICRWWKSDFYDEKPELNKLYEGMMKANVENGYWEWVEIKKIVFRAFDMKLFYNEHAYMYSFLKISGKTVGETAFGARKPKDMDESIDIYQAKGIKKFEKKFFMEWGFK
ncbi:MAG TPA: DUF432 domain-containing protein [Thermoplasmata archaeon]|nr:DUF432 domain-containing protein [Thermoplasmata archaeon]